MKNLADFLSSLRDRHAGESPDLDGPLQSCINCQARLEDSPDYQQFRVCHACRFHYTIGAPDRIALLADPGSFHETHPNLISIDPLSFDGQSSYRQRIFEEQRRTGLTDAIVTGTATIHGQAVVLAVIDFRFFGGSLGCVVGERLTLALELAAHRRLPVVVVVASGGIRMQEGLLSLAQVAKTAAAAERLTAAHVPLISLLANPTIGAAYAGFVGLSDVIVAEPGAIVGYATTRAVEESSGGKLPPGAHTAESHIEHGLLDDIVDRSHQRDYLSALIFMLASSYRLTQTRSTARSATSALPDQAWKTVQLARHARRPSARDYIADMTTSFVELRGDRTQGDDPAVVCGVGQLGGQSVMLVGQERWHGDGQAAGIRPEGFRKARRAMLLAAKLRLPVITLIDTTGAAADLRSEEHGLGAAIASCLAVSSALPVPTVGVIIGEGASEAAVAFGIVNRLLMMENAIFVPVSPETAASILYRDAGQAEAAAKALRLTASDCVRLGVVDGIIPEPVGGAHASHEEAAREVKLAVLRELTAIQTERPRSLVRQRYRKVRNMGRYSNYLGMRVKREVSEIGESVGRGAAALVSRIRHPGAAQTQNSDESMLIP